MNTDTYPVAPKTIADCGTPKNPPVQISDDFIMPREVATRLIVCNKISNTLRKRCKRAMQTAVLSRAPILQEMVVDSLVSQTTVGDITTQLVIIAKGDRVYNLAAVGKTADQLFSKLVSGLTMRQLVLRLKRIPAFRRRAQWAALHGMNMPRRAAAEQRVNALDAFADFLETEIQRRTGL